jgi:riboflavin synthase
MGGRVFTGIVEERGEVVAVEPLPDGARLTVAGPLVTSDAQLGDSIAVNGVCLTVVESAGGRFTVDVVRETLRRSSLDKVRAGDRVNLERAVAVGQRFGGHIVQGHVDGTGALLSRDKSGLTRFGMPAQLARFVVEKGSIAVDGVSLTVVEVGDDWFSVALIPTTLDLTTLGERGPGDPVNLEVDVMAKYVQRLAEPHLARFSERGEPAGTGAGHE